MKVYVKEEEAAQEEVDEEQDEGFVDDLYLFSLGNSTAMTGHTLDCNSHAAFGNPRCRHCGAAQ